MVLPSSLSSSLEPPASDCGGHVTELLSQLMTKLIVNGVQLSEFESQAIYAAMLIASSDHYGNMMDGRIDKEYDLNKGIRGRDSAGYYLATEHFSKVWFDCITRQELVLVSYGQLAIMDGLWCYGAISFENYHKQIPCGVTFFPVADFHMSLDSSGSNRFRPTGKYIAPPGGPELA